MLYKRSRRTEEKNAEALLSALLREVMPDGGKIPVRQLSDGRARAQLREKPFLALEVETFRAEAKSRTGAIRPTGAERPAWTMQESFRARLLTETKEEIFLFPSSPPSPDLPSDISSCTDRTDPAAALAARLRAELTRPTAKTSSPEAGKYRLKVNVLEDFTYLPRWKELGHTNVRIGGKMPENRDGDPGDADRPDAASDTNGDGDFPKKA